METDIQSAYREELQRLEQTAAEMDHQLEILQQIPRYFGNDLTEQALDRIRETKRRNLQAAVTEPYFGRMDFHETGKVSATPLYIGKVGVEKEETGKLLVIDWRAPVASLFYSFTGGEDPAFYESPDGMIEGLVYLKRNLVIRKQILQRVVDSYVRGRDNLGVADEFLLYRLEENKDNKLRDIVSTIQAEQDRIIRSSKNKALIIQGVAGSGKTTVALHRLAYLLYQYREQIHAENMIIFAPNSMFLDYISGVLPELGVGGIQQTTFAAWALDRLKHEVTVSDPAERFAKWFGLSGQPYDSIEQTAGRVKGSVRFLQIIEQALVSYEASFIPDDDLQAWPGVTLSDVQIRHWFYIEYKHYALATRRERLMGRMKRWLDMELDQVADPNRKKDLRKRATQRLRTYLKKLPDHTAFTFYKQLFRAAKQPDFLTQETLADLQELPSEIRDASNRKFKRNEVDPEDLAPLLYIQNRLHGIERQAIFDHVVVDEAQDFSPFQIALLKQNTPGHSFTILGDLSQGIHADQGIRDWQELQSQFDPEETAFFQLTRSYRSTMEIIQFANQVLRRSGEPVTLAQPVFRSGEPVQVLQVPGKEQLDKVTAVERLIRDWEAKQASTIAVIGRTEEECKDLHQALAEAGVGASLIESKQTEYSGGISVLPVYLAKGLEFDGVILTDVDERHYGLNVRDAKLLYVGCTRALHRLALVFAGDLSPLIRDQRI